MSSKNKHSSAKANIDWTEQAANILKAELARNGITYEELAKRLNEIGVDESVNTVRLKLFRGTFQFAFFLQCAVALGIKNLRLDDLIDKVNNALV